MHLVFFIKQFTKNMENWKNYFKTIDISSFRPFPTWKSGWKIGKTFNN